MHINKHFLACLAIGVALVGCEIPKSPNFTTSHKVEAPLMYDKTFQFMGDSTALVDTTASDMDSLFTVDANNFITISKEQDFDFGDLNDAIPTIDVDPTSFESEVGELSLTDFSSDGSGNLGEANFQDLTGIDPAIVNQGDPVPNQTVSPEVTVDLNTDLFESATFKDGALNISLQNNLGFNLDDINVTLVSDPDPSVNGDENDVASGSSGTINDNTSATISIPFTGCDVNPSSCQLANPAVRVSIEWTGGGQTFQREPESIVVVSAVGDNLTASQVRAALESQDFSTSSTATFSADEFQFTETDHFVELASGEIVIAPIQNDLEFDIDLSITFADIRSCQASLVSDIPEVINHDPLTIEYTSANNTEITRGGSSNSVTVSLAECELYATNNEVTFTIDAATENTKTAPVGDRIRVINETQSVSSSVEISNLSIARATGIIKQQVVLLNEDEGEDEQLSLFNDNEAEITEIDGLSELSSQLDNLNFTNPRLSINYTTNISVPTTIYGAFVGINGQGEQVYLKGESTEYSVQSGDPISGMNKENGQPLSPDEMIKFSLAENLDGSTISATIEFNRTTTNVDDFLNNLPSDIRFIGKAVINEDENVATIVDPLEFEPKISIDIPLAFETPEAATFTDTVKQDFSGMPSPDNGDDNAVTEGVISIDYENGLPLGFNLNISFMDSTNTIFTSIPVAGDPSISLTASGVDPATRFATDPSSGTIEIALNESQLRELYKTRFLKIEAALQTTNNEEVRVRTTDAITLSVRARLTIESEVQ